MTVLLLTVLLLTAYLTMLAVMVLLCWIWSLESGMKVLADRITQLEDAVTKPTPPGPRRVGYL